MFSFDYAFPISLNMLVDLILNNLLNIFLIAFQQNGCI